MSATNTPISQLPDWKAGQRTIESRKMQRLTDTVRELCNRNPPRAPNLAPGPRGSVGLPRTVKIISVSALKFSCKDIDDAGAEVGDAFDVYPRVIAGGSGYTATYDLTATTGTVVIEKFAAGSYLDIIAAEVALHRAAGAAPLRWHTWDAFHLSSCTV